MKTLFSLLIALLAVCIAYTLLFFLLPSWQLAAVEHILARDTHRKWQVESVELLPWRVAATGVFLLEGPVGAEIKGFEVSGPFWRSPLSRVLEVESGAIMGLHLDLAQLRVGDLTSSDWQQFLGRVAGDAEFWQERLGLVLHKVAASGWHVRIRDTDLHGTVLMPGQKTIPVNWRIIEADSRDPAAVRLEPVAL